MFSIVSTTNFKEKGAAHTLEGSSWSGMWFLGPVLWPFLRYSIFTHTSSSADATPGKVKDWIPEPTEICQISSRVNHTRATAFGSIATIHCSWGPHKSPLLISEALSMLLRAEVISYPLRARTETKNEIVPPCAVPSGSATHEASSRPCTSLYLVNFLVTRWKTNPVPTCNNCPNCPGPSTSFLYRADLDFVSLSSRHPPSSTLSAALTCPLSAPCLYF